MTERNTILGIVAEYDPFHNGHAYHITQARKAANPDTVYAVLSPCLKQRGELSLLSPFQRAECAVRGGVDAVFSLPVLWTIRDAEHYALGAVSLLCGLGITHLAFGAETKDLDKLRLCADFLENPPSSFSEKLRSILDQGTGYPAALSEAFSFFCPDAGDVISSPNNILAVCYLRALKKVNPDVVPIAVMRTGAYHNPRIELSAPSASALRKAFSRGDYYSSFQALPDYSALAVKHSFLSHHIPDPCIWDAMVLNAVLTSDLSALPDLSEGLQYALINAARSCTSVRDLITGLSSRRYTASRISRLCAYAVLGVSAERIRHLSLPDETMLLAIRKNKVPTGRWKDLPVRISCSAGEWKNMAAPEDIACWRIWSSCCHLPDTLPFTGKIYSE